MSPMIYKAFHVLQPERTLLSPEALSGGHLPTVTPTIGDDTGHMAAPLHLRHFQHYPNGPR